MQVFQKKLGLKRKLKKPDTDDQYIEKNDGPEVDKRHKETTKKEERKIKPIPRKKRFKDKEERDYESRVHGNPFATYLKNMDNIDLQLENLSGLLERRKQLGAQKKALKNSKQATTDSEKLKKIGDEIKTNKKDSKSLGDEINSTIGDIKGLLRENEFILNHKNNPEFKAGRKIPEFNTEIDAEFPGKDGMPGKILELKSAKNFKTNQFENQLRYAISYNKTYEYHIDYCPKGNQGWTDGKISRNKNIAEESVAAVINELQDTYPDIEQRVRWDFVKNPPIDATDLDGFKKRIFELVSFAPGSPPRTIFKE